MREFARPAVVVSKCLGFAHCRYNGATIPDGFVARLRAHVDFRPVCPEVEIGLGVPRDPVRVVAAAGGPRLVQPATGADCTAGMLRFAASFLASLGRVDGFLLKSRSPSCGIKDVKVYTEAGRAAGRKGRGLFGEAVWSRFPGLAIEDEGRLRNFAIREHFLARLFALADLRRVRSIGNLIRYHTANKLLLMAYNQKELKRLGQVVANRDGKPVGELIGDYEAHLKRALSRAVRHTSNINVLMHTLGHLSANLSAREKAFFLESLQDYREGKVPLSALLGILRAWIVRFENAYLAGQSYLEPYPEELVEITDSGKGRDL